MITRVTRQPPPNFHEIGEYNFQRLCNELFHHEPNIGNATEYGRRGEPQRGIDILASLNPYGVEVGQCKCEKSFTVAKVQRASREFIKHLEFWKDNGARRFILFVGCEITNIKIRDEELIQRKIFSTHGIRYEIWDAATIRTKLRPHRSIAQTYLDSDAAVIEICGPVVESPSIATGIINLTNRLGFMATDLESAREHELTQLREQSRKGQHGKALSGIHELKKKPSWLDHSSKFRAKVIRFEAALELNLSRNVPQALLLVQEARLLDPDGDYQTIETYIHYCQYGPEQALKKLETPTCIEAQNLRWGLLFESGNLDDLEKESSAPPPHALDAESYRLIALLQLNRRRISESRQAIGKAEQIAPSHFNIQYARAIIEFYSSVSDAAEGVGRVSWPLPVNWAFVKRDTNSSANLEKIANEFKRWSNCMERSPTERENSKVWYLACHACIETKQEYASEIAKNIIECDPANHGVVTWALHRGYEFDLQAVFSALQERLLQEPDNIEICLATWSLTFSLKDNRDSEDLVDASEDTFRRTGNADLWLFHKIQFLAARNDFIEAENLIRQIKDEHLRREAKLNLLRRQAQTRNELWGELAGRIQEAYDISGNAQLLMECCDLKLHLNDFAYVSEHSDLLITSIGTAPALRLALEGTYKNGDFQQCLSLITNFQHLFRDGVISPDIRQLRAVCMHKLGDWSEAIGEAERIYAEFPEIGNLISLFDLLVRTGDTRRCSSLARDLLIIKGADPSQLLTAASFIHVHDLGLARSLWRTATQKPIKKSNLSFRLRAMELAYTLGLSREASDLLNSLVEASHKGKGPLKMKTFEETVELFREQRKFNEKNSKLYMQGNVPIHLLIEFLNMPMVQLLHHQVYANREDRNLLKSPIIFGRSGNRPVETISPKCIIADITAIILMADLNLLDETEVALGPIYISPAITISLMEQIRKVTPNQPDRCESRETFCRLAKSGRIATLEVPSAWTYISPDLRERIGSEAAALLEIAVREEGVLIYDGLVSDLSSPFMPAPLPPEVAKRIRQTVELTNYLQPAIHPAIFPFSEGSLVLVPHVVVAGLSSQFWETASQCFRLAVIPETLKDLEAEVQADQNAESLAEWTQGLLDRLQRGIASGKYRILPAAKQLKNDGKWGTGSQSLADILAYDPPQGRVVWCDDRMLNRHLFANSARIVGISEVLKLLRKKGLSDASYFDAIIHLRRSNIRYIPISPEEILYHLKLSELKEGRITENSRLATIRRYLNATLLDKEWLQPPLLLEEGTKDLREYAYPLGLFRSVDEAIFLLWKDDDDPKMTEARADWLLNNLHIDILGFRQCLNTGCNADEVRNSLGAMVGMLFVKGVALPRIGTDLSYSPRRAYFRWLTQRLLKPVIASNPSLLNLVCENVADSIRDQLSAITQSAPPDNHLLEFKVHHLRM